jgi:hypothetical protein
MEDFKAGDLLTRRQSGGDNILYMVVNVTEQAFPKEFVTPKVALVLLASPKLHDHKVPMLCCVATPATYLGNWVTQEGLKNDGFVKVDANLSEVLKNILNIIEAK